MKNKKDITVTRKLWLLKPQTKQPKGEDPWEPWYDKVFGLVVCDETEEAARQMAHKEGCDENREHENIKAPWLDPKHSSCVELTSSHKAGVVIRDFASA